MWAKFIFLKNGISPREFNKCSMRDVVDMMDIQKSISERQRRQSKVDEVMSKINLRKW